MQIIQRCQRSRSDSMKVLSKIDQCLMVTVSENEVGGRGREKGSE